MEVLEIEYDKYGRMKYNKEFHPNAGEPWTKEDMDYLIKWYRHIGPEEMSLALGRTEVTVSDRFSKLKKQGLVNKNQKSRKHTRLLNKVR